MLNFKSDKEISSMVGKRLCQARLQNNISQSSLAVSAGISIKAVQSAEKGESKLTTYIKILRVLKLLDQLENFIPEPVISPIAIAKMKGSKRHRASSKK